MTMVCEELAALMTDRYGLKMGPMTRMFLLTAWMGPGDRFKAGAWRHWQAFKDDPKSARPELYKYLTRMAVYHRMWPLLSEILATASIDSPDLITAGTAQLCLAQPAISESKASAQIVLLLVKKTFEADEGLWLRVINYAARYRLAELAELVIDRMVALLSKEEGVLPACFADAYWEATGRKLL